MPANPYSQEEKDIMIDMRANGAGSAAIANHLKEEGFFRTAKSVTCWLNENKNRMPQLRTKRASPVYTAAIKDYILTCLETKHNKSQIAREVKRVFGLDQDIEAIGSAINTIVVQANFEVEDEPVRRLFFDIETSFMLGWFWRPSYKTSIGPHQVIENTKIICISYKWQHEDEVHTVIWDDDQDDKKLLQEFVKILGAANEIVAHNGDKFDMKVFRTRCIAQDVLMFPRYRTFDTLKKARGFFAFPSNKLDELGNFLGVGRKMETGGHELWEDIVLHRDPAALKKMVKYCERDVILLEDVFTKMCPYVDHNTNFAVQKRLDKWHCPECTSEQVKLSHTDTTPMGYIKRIMKCLRCKKSFHVSNRTYLRWLGADTGMDPDNKK